MLLTFHHMLLREDLLPNYGTGEDECEKKCSTYHSLNFSNTSSITNQFLCTEELNLAQYLETQVVSDLGVPAQLQVEQPLLHTGYDVAWNTVSLVTVNYNHKLQHHLLILVYYNLNLPMVLEWTGLVELTATVRAVIWSMARMYAFMAYYVRNVVETLPTCPTNIWTFFCVCSASYNVQ